MNIALIGWYFQNNAGDDRMLFCIKQELIGHSVQVFQAWAEVKERIEEINKNDLLIIGGGGVFTRNANGLLPFFKKIKIPIMLLGIGIQSDAEDNAKCLEYLQKNTFISVVRDSKSYNYLKGAKNLIQGPDLTFLYPFKSNLQLVEAGTLGVSLRFWHYWGGDQYSKHYYKIKKWNNRFPLLKNLYPKYWNESKLINILNKTNYSIRPLPLYFNDLNGDNEILSKYFDQVDQQFNINSFQGCEYILGMRFHSTVFATQLGIPFLSLSYMKKNEEFNNSLGLSQFAVNLNEINRIPFLLEELKRNKEEIKERLLQYTNKAHCEIKEIVSYVKNECGL